MADSKKVDPLRQTSGEADTEKLISELSGAQLESTVATILSANALSVELSREFTAQVDLVIGIRNQFQHMERIAVELKAFRRPVGLEAVQQLAGAVASLQATRGLLVTTSTFTAEALRAAETMRSVVQLVDRSGLAEWIKAYQTQRELFAAALAFRIPRLHVVEFSRAEGTDVDSLVVDETPERLVKHPYRQGLIRVDRLPFRLLQAVMEDPRHLRELSPREFEEFTAEVLDTLGFEDVYLTPRTGDGGRDVIASRQVNEIPLTFYFECKKYAESNKVRLSEVRSLLGVVAHHDREANIGVLVTTSTFTAGAKKLILGESRLDGKDYEGILGWISEAKNRITEAG